MPYAENVVSGTGVAYMRDRAYLSRAYMWCALVRRAWVAGAGKTAWVRGACDCRHGWDESVGRVLLAARCPCQGGVWVVVWGSCRRGVFLLCGVRCAWAGATSGGSFRAVALVVISGIRLLLCGGRVICGNVPNSAYVQGGQE
jgi:hypothetical protein